MVKLERAPIDFSKPFRHWHSRINTKVEYISKKETRDGKPITDGYVHLILFGEGRKQQAVYANDLGEVVQEGKPFKMFIQDPPPEEVQDKAKGKKSPSSDADVTQLVAATESFERGILALGEDVRAMTEVMQKESVSLKQLIHRHLEQQAEMIKGFVKVISQTEDRLHKAYQDTATHLKNATEEQRHLLLEGLAMMSGDFTKSCDGLLTGINNLLDEKDLVTSAPKEVEKAGASSVDTKAESDIPASPVATPHHRKPTVVKDFSQLAKVATREH